MDSLGGGHYTSKIRKGSIGGEDEKTTWVIFEPHNTGEAGVLAKCLETFKVSELLGTKGCAPVAFCSAFTQQ